MPSFSTVHGAQKESRAQAELSAVKTFSCFVQVRRSLLSNASNQVCSPKAMETVAYIQ